MIKGLIALFTSGIIFSPMVLLGVIAGACAILMLSSEALRGLFSDYHFYALAAFLSAVWTFGFSKIYQEGGVDVDWQATSWRAVWNFVRFLISFVLAMCFVVLISLF